ncbi:hypothetical protein [Anaeromassilibacillus senegalensis]|nr:hypothetical protein [Anaeromassilibacillus senegalensis]
MPSLPGNRWRESVAFIPTATLPLVPIRNSQAILVTGTEKQIVP